MKQALILSGKVVEVSSTRFPVAPSLQWVDCPDDTKPGYAYTGSAFVEPVRASDVPDKLKEREISFIAGEGVQALVLALSDLYNRQQLTPPAEFVQYAQKIKAISDKYQKV